MQNEGGVDGEGDRESRGIPKDYEGVRLITWNYCIYHKLTTRG
jgi:hypothetical protein